VSLLPQGDAGGFSIQVGVNALGDSDADPETPPQGIAGGGAALLAAAAATAAAAADGGDSIIVASPAN
jgi:hypothetical protein